jgi:hypothetical protein
VTRGGKAAALIVALSLHAAACARERTAPGSASDAGRSAAPSAPPGPRAAIAAASSPGAAPAEAPLVPCRDGDLERWLKPILAMPRVDWQCKPGRFPEAGWAVLARGAPASPDGGGDCTDPDRDDEAEPKRLLAIVDPRTGSLRQRSQTLVGWEERCASTETLDHVIDLDRDGTDEIVTSYAYDHDGEIGAIVFVHAVRNKTVARIGQIPVSFEAPGADESSASCEGEVTAVPPDVPGGPALRLDAKVSGGKLARRVCVPGHHLFRVAGGKLVANRADAPKGATAAR